MFTNTSRICRRAWRAPEFLALSGRFRDIWGYLFTFSLTFQAVSSVHEYGNPTDRHHPESRVTVPAGT